MPVPAPLRKVDLIRAGRVSRTAVIPLEPIPRRRRLEGDDPGTLEVRGVLGEASGVCNPEAVSLYDPVFTHAPRLKFEARLLNGEASELEVLLI